MIWAVLLLLLPLLAFFNQTGIFPQQS